MLSREEALIKIRSIDQQMNDIIANNPSMRASYNPTPFPWGAAIITAIASAGYVYGETVPQIAPYRDYVMYAAGVFGVLTVLLILRWVVGLGGRGNKAYREANARLVELRKQKAILQGQLHQAK